MSRLGKKPIEIPNGVTVSFDNGIFSVKGPKGELKKEFKPIIEIKIEGSEITLTPKAETIESKALWGTYASHIGNMIEGVTNGYSKKLLIDGVGFKMGVTGNEVVLSVGFTNEVKLEIPEGLEVVPEKNTLTVNGIDKEAVGSFAAKIRSQKKPEPYKGKGIRYDGEVILRKQGKKTA